MLSASCSGVVPDLPAPTIKTGEISRSCPNGMAFHWFSRINPLSVHGNRKQSKTRFSADSPLRQPGERNVLLGSRATLPGHKWGEEAFANNGGSTSDREGWFAEMKHHPNGLWIPTARSGIDYENLTHSRPARWLRTPDSRMPAIAIWSEPDQ